MKDPWALPEGLLATDKILFKVRQRGLLNPYYSVLKEIVESVCGPSEYTDTHFEGSNALGQAVKKSQSPIQ